MLRASGTVATGQACAPARTGHPLSRARGARGGWEPVAAGRGNGSLRARLRPGRLPELRHGHAHARGKSHGLVVYSTAMPCCHLLQPPKTTGWHQKLQPGYSCPIGPRRRRRTQHTVTLTCHAISLSLSLLPMHAACNACFGRCCVISDSYGMATPAP